MHDVEHNTIIYLRDVLVTDAHLDHEITSFLTFWAFEEYFHGEAIGRVLEAHGEPGSDRAGAAEAPTDPARPHHPGRHDAGVARHPPRADRAHDVGRHQRVDRAGRLRTARRPRPSTRPCRRSCTAS